MYSQISFETLLNFGSVPGNADLDYYALEANHLEPEEWSELGMLKKRPIGSTVCCRGCGSSAAVTVRDSESGIRVCADCHECGVYELFPEEKVLWRVNFTPVFESTRKALNCSGGIMEIVPDALWSLGRAPIGGQSREIFACAGINTYRNPEILDRLPNGKTPILLVLGDPPRPYKLGMFPPDQVFCFSQMARIEDGKIVFESSILHSQVAAPSSSEPLRRKVSSGKNSKIGDAIIKLKTELRQFMCGVYSEVSHAERSGKEPRFLGIRQNELAAAANVSTVMVNRALKKDMELKALFDAANDRGTAYAYGRRAMK